MKMSATTALSDHRVMAWDTDWWGVRIGNATHLDGVSKWAEENAVGLVCLLADTIAEAQRAEESGFRLVDVRVTLGRHVTSCGSGGRLAIPPDDLAPIQQIAGEAFRGLTRFYNDFRLDDGRCDDLYREWARAQLAGAADIVFVAERDGKVAGFVTVDRPDEETARIVLIAVYPDFRNRGVGADLVSTVSNWAKAQRCSRVTVVTQGANVPALCLFQATGFRSERTQYWLHRWYQ